MSFSILSSNRSSEKQKSDRWSAFLLSVILSCSRSVHFGSEDPSSSSLERTTEEEKSSLHILQDTDLSIHIYVQTINDRLSGRDFHSLRISDEQRLFSCSMLYQSTLPNQVKACMHGSICTSVCFVSLLTLFTQHPQSYLTIKRYQPQHSCFEEYFFSVQASLRRTSLIFHSHKINCKIRTGN